MRIYLRGGNLLMSQHCLYCPQISTALKKMGGKRMPESVWTYVFSDTGLCGQILHHIEYHYPGDWLSPTETQKKEWFVM